MPGVQLEGNKGLIGRDELDSQKSHRVRRSNKREDYQYFGINKEIIDRRGSVYICNDNNFERDIKRELGFVEPEQIVLNASHDSLEGGEKEASYHSWRSTSPEKDGEPTVVCPGKGCGQKLHTLGGLRRHWNDRHERQVILFLCPFRGCFKKRKSRFELFGHLRNYKHPGYSTTFNSSNHVRQYYRSMPPLCELKTNQDYQAPGEVPPQERPVTGPLQLPQNAVPFSGKKDLQQEFDDLVLGTRLPGNPVVKAVHVPSIESASSPSPDPSIQPRTITLKTPERPVADPRSGKDRPSLVVSLQIPPWVRNKTPEAPSTPKHQLDYKHS